MEPPNWTNPLLRIEETHISVLIFLGDRVYKIRKPVHFGFLDFRDRVHCPWTATARSTQSAIVAGRVPRRC